MEEILKKIVDARRASLERRKREFAAGPMVILAEQMGAPEFDFLAVLTSVNSHGIHIIAEVKRASPSKGIICRDFDPLLIARKYFSAGASAVSVLTEEEFFLGQNSYLEEIARKVRLPALRKDFIIDAYQLYEARCLGAAAVLLIVDCLSPGQLVEYIGLAGRLGMAALVEVHREDEVRLALDCGAQIIGVNNRNLRTFETRLETTAMLRHLIPGGIPVVSESGIHDAGDMAFLREHEVQAALVGEFLVRDLASIEQNLKLLLGVPPP